MNIEMLFILLYFEPVTFEEVITNNKWVDALKDEIRSLSVGTSVSTKSQEINQCTVGF